ncbi:PTS system mannose-specific EIID component [Serratia fonticola]|uniref:PTS system mannose-specific EIID component n=1 Tax=Serratia fonticola TaxID=47917 RepID=A0A4U9W6W3_SERFO|nr:PTS system mannose-specific EIID component [Serratia fonticola]
MLVSSKSSRLREALSLLGVFVMGGVAASYVKLGTGLEFITKDGVNIQLQHMLDGIFPNLMPLIVVLATWYLMAKRGLSPVKAMLGLLVLAAAGVACGLFFLILLQYRAQPKVAPVFHQGSNLCHCSATLPGLEINWKRAGSASNCA